MGTRVITEKFSDLDGSDATRTTKFALDGRAYIIDLSEEQDEEFRAFMEKYVEVAAKDTGDRPTTSYRPNAGAGLDKEQLRAIRDWAKSQGIPVHDRGRLPQNVIDMFNQRHTIEAAGINEAAKRASEHLQQDTIPAVDDTNVPISANGAVVQVPRGKVVPTPMFSDEEEPVEPAPKPAVKRVPKKSAALTRRKVTTR